MKIPGLAKIASDYALSQPLNNSTLVFDAQNFFYNMYKSSNLPFIFGCECDQYLEYLKRYLSMFKIANVKCYFLFKGGGIKSADKRKNIERFYAGQHDKPTTVAPVFMWEIHRQVLSEMGFDYAVCEYESKRECIALAQKLQCPVVSNDIEFCFSGVPYISYYSFKLNQKILTGDVFKLDRFLVAFKIDEDKLATFAAMMDQYNFPVPADHFPRMFNSEILGSGRLNSPRDYCAMYLRIFRWMASRGHGQIMDRILVGISPEDKTKFFETEKQVKEMIRRRETTGIPSEYLEKACRIEITPQDPLWFEKGVVSGTISLLYIYMYRSSSLFGSNAVIDHVNKIYNEADEPLLFSAEIFKYAYDLLTNFKGGPLEIQTNEGANIVVTTSRIARPCYEAKESVFENGWDGIKSLGLFEHFVAQTMPDLKLESLKDLPEDVKLLMIALLYFRYYSSHEAKNEIAGSVILSYVFLGVLNENTSLSTEPNNNKTALSMREKREAKTKLSKYATHISYKAASDIFEPKLIHPLVQFQYCLDHFGFLNKLCGSPYKPIVFSKMYNGTFVYRVLYKIVHETNGDVLGFLSQELDTMPNVLSILKSLIRLYYDA